MKSTVIFCVFIIVTSCEDIPELFRLPKINITVVPDFEDRIFGGTKVKDGDLPYMVLLLSKTVTNEISRCSGALLKKNLVLAAAHCFPNVSIADNTIVVAGKADVSLYMKVRKSLDWKRDVPSEKLFGAQERRGSHLRIHSKYNASSYTHDLAILRLGVPFVLSNNVQTINISTSENNIGLTCTISGWGETNDVTTGYQLVTADDIRIMVVGKGCLHKRSGSFYCLANEKSGICKGDSGSPLVCNGQIWGVASHLSSLTSHPQCGEDYEQYYADVLPEERFFLEAADIGESLPSEKGTGMNGSDNKLVTSNILLLAFCTLSKL